MTPYRPVSSGIWQDDDFLALSQEQKLTYLYLISNPHSSACGIYPLKMKTMAAELGAIAVPFESMLKGLALAHPQFVVIDWETKEVAIPLWVRSTLLTPNAGTLKHIEKEIGKVRSIPLLQSVIKAISARLGKPYLAHLRRLQVEKINAARFDGDLYKLPENEPIVKKIEKENILFSYENKSEENNEAEIEDWEPVSKLGRPPKFPVYEMFQRWANFIQEKTDAPIPLNSNGFPIMDSKSANNIRLWAQWYSQLPKSPDDETRKVEDAWAAFLEAAWKHSDVWLKQNFTCDILNSKKTNILTTVRLATKKKAGPDYSQIYNAK